MLYDNELTSLYEKYKLKWNHDVKNGIVDKSLLDHLSCPLLLHVEDNAWSASTEKILFIGQENKGWDADNEKICTFRDFLTNSSSVSVMKNVYSGFNFAEHYRRSPFWQAFKKISKNAENDEPYKVLWTNVYRFCLDRGSVLRGNEREIQQISTLNFGILAEEIKILQPKAVIFATGPNYDKGIQDSFVGAKLVDFSPEYNQRMIARVEHAGLPIASFRVYHPQYLWFRKSRHVLDLILRKIKEMS